VQRPASASRLKSTTGGVLLVLGSLLTLFHLNSLMLQFQPLFSNPLADTLDSSARLGITLLHAVQTAVFDHALLFSMASNILVLFSAFTITLVGVVLRNRANRPTAPDRLTTPASEGGQ
jgi:hypothetical protein